MKKAFAAIVLLASSSGMFALPASAHDRDNHFDNRASVYNTYDRRDHDRDRDWRDVRRVNVRDTRGGYGFGVSVYGPNCR
jgi:hypothetical protein